MRTVVVDATAGVEMALRTAPGRRLLTEIGPGADTWVPEHFYVEVAGVLRRFVARRDIDSRRGQRALDRLLAISLRRVSVKPLLSEAWRLGANLTIADALYVVVARHLDAELATLDERLARAPTLGVRVLTVPSGR